ncbi:hypothetical protein M0Q50_04070 [bacterium]|jgi:hypothetical protein|nr:hypothetical protein [bacterium]
MEKLREYQTFIGKPIFCIKDDKSFKLTKGKSYKIQKIVEKNDSLYAIIINDNGSEFGIGPNNSKYFLNLKEGLMVLRDLKLKSLNNENLDS